MYEQSHWQAFLDWLAAVGTSFSWRSGQTRRGFRRCKPRSLAVPGARRRKRSLWSRCPFTLRSLFSSVDALKRARHPQCEALEQRVLLSVSPPDFSSRASHVSVETIDQYGTALIGSQWEKEVGLSKADIKQAIDSDTWRELLKSDDNEFIKRFRLEAKQAGRVDADRWLKETLAEANLPKLSLASLDWFDAAPAELEKLPSGYEPIIAAPLTESANRLRFDAETPFSLDLSGRLAVNYHIDE